MVEKTVRITVAYSNHYVIIYKLNFFMLLKVLIYIFSGLANAINDYIQMRTRPLG